MHHIWCLILELIVGVVSDQAGIRVGWTFEMVHPCFLCANFQFECVSKKTTVIYCISETHLATRKCICISMWFSKRFRIAVFLRENHVGFAQATYTFYNESYMICTKKTSQNPPTKIHSSSYFLPKLLGQCLPLRAAGVQLFSFRQPAGVQGLRCENGSWLLQWWILTPPWMHVPRVLVLSPLGRSYWRTSLPGTENVHEEMQPPLKKGGLKRTWYLSNHWVSGGYVSTIKDIDVGPYYIYMAISSSLT